MIEWQTILWLFSAADRISIEKWHVPPKLEVKTLDASSWPVSCPPQVQAGRMGSGMEFAEVSVPLLPKVKGSREGDDREVCSLVTLCPWDLGMFKADVQTFFPGYLCGLLEISLSVFPMT